MISLRVPGGNGYGEQNGLNLMNLAPTDSLQFPQPLLMDIQFEINGNGNVNGQRLMGNPTVNNGISTANSMGNVNSMLMGNVATNTMQRMDIKMNMGTHSHSHSRSRSRSESHSHSQPQVERTQPIPAPLTVNGSVGGQSQSQNVNANRSGNGGNGHCRQCLGYISKISELLKMNQELNEECSAMKQLRVKLDRITAERDHWKELFQNVLGQNQQPMNQQLIHRQQQQPQQQPPPRPPPRDQNRSEVPSSNNAFYPRAEVEEDETLCFVLSQSPCPDPQSRCELESDPFPLCPQNQAMSFSANRATTIHRMPPRSSSECRSTRRRGIAI